MVSKDETGVDVVVVGAGISGLMVATALIEAGRSVVVLEARDRVGGRLQSAGGDASAIDLGATWFWPGEERVERLNRDLAMAVHDQHIAGDVMFDDGKAVQRVEGNPIDVPAYRWSQGAASLPEAVADRLPTGTIRLNEPVTTVAFVGSGGAADPDNTADPEDADPGDAPDPEDAGGPERTAGEVVVTSSVGTYRADQVVLALPPALAVARIEVIPPLPPSLADMARMTPVWMGAMTKVVATYGRPFWREHGLSGSAFSHRGPLREIHDMSGVDGQAAALFGFAPMAEPGGPSPEAVTAQLAALFGPAGGEPDAVHVLDWRAELHTSPADVERHTGYHTYGHAAYAQPLFNRRLHWSSTETSPVAPGHVEGALAAAERTANTILHDRSTKGAP